MDEHLADCVLLGFCLSHFSFFFLAAEDSSCLEVVKWVWFLQTCWKVRFFFSPSDEPLLVVLQPLAAVYWIAAALMWSAVKESAWILSLWAFFFFFYKLQFRTVFHIPSRPAFKIRSSQPPLVPAQLNKGHVKINDSQRKHLTVFCSTLRCWKCIIISLILTCVNASAVHLDANGIRAARWRL